MWLFTEFGFYSIVQKTEEDHLTVRARVAADLDALRARCMPDLSPTSATKSQDYPFRAHISHAAFARGLARLGENLHYRSFREQVLAGHGKEREKVYSEMWSGLHKLEAENGPASPEQTAAIAGRRQAFGAVVMNCNGQVLLREPFNHRGGHAWTFPKDSPKRGEKPEDTAARAVVEKTGVRARVVEQIPGIFNGDTTSGCYFLMTDEGQAEKNGHGSKGVMWASRDEAEARIKASSSPLSRARDLEVLNGAYSLHARRYRQGEMEAGEINAVEDRLLNCAALRFDGYRYSDRVGCQCTPNLDHFLQTGELPVSPLDQLCLFFTLQRRLMKWNEERSERDTPEWNAFRRLFLQTASYCIPPEYRYPEYYDRWRSEYLPKLDECTALVQVIHRGTVYPAG